MSNSIKTGVLGQQGLTEHTPINHAHQAALAKAQGARVGNKTTRRPQNPFDDHAPDAGHNEHADTLEEKHQGGRPHPGGNASGEASRLAGKLSLPQANSGHGSAATGFSLQPRAESHSRAREGRANFAPVTYKSVDPTLPQRNQANVEKLATKLRDSSGAVFAAMDQMAQHFERLRAKI